MVKQLASQGMDIGDMLIQVRNDVMSATRGKQVPWEHSALTAKFYFSAPIPAAAAAPDAGQTSTPSQPGLTYEQQMEIALWNRVKDSKDPAELQAYVDRFPQGAFASLARILIQRAKREEAQRVAALREELLEEARRKAEAGRTPATAATPALPVAAAPTAIPPRDAPPGMDKEALARILQGELRRVGCDPGAVDGRWGGKTTEALKTFASYAKVKVPWEEPSLAALDAVTARKDRVCPLVCDDGEIEVKGKCVAKQVTRSATKAKTPVPRRETQTRRTAAPEDRDERSGGAENSSGPKVRPCLPVIGGCGGIGIRLLPF